MGGGQAIMIDPVNGTLMGASDPRKDGLAIGYGATVISRLIVVGHRQLPPGVLRSSMGGGQAIMIDPVNKTLMGASKESTQRRTGYRLLICQRLKRCGSRV